MFLDKLRGVVKDEREIEYVFAAAAGGSMRTRSGRSVQYLTSDSPSQLFAQIWFRNGRITDLKAGPPIQDEKSQDALVERASLETRETHGSFVATRLQTAALELKGCWMWRDQVRISPVPPSARIASDRRALGDLSRRAGPTGPPYPFLLEVKIPRSPNGILEGWRTLWRLDSYQNLLTLLLAPRITSVATSADRLWTVEQREHGLVSVLAQAGFVTGEDGRLDDFPERSVPPAPTYSGQDYYNHLWIREAEIQIPPTLADDFDRFNALPRAKQADFMRACYWYSLAIEHRAEHALAHVSFAAAIECLLPREPKTACACCNKPLGDGPTQLFAKHIKRYGGIPAELAKQRDAMYSIRSELVHGIYAGRIDVGFFSSAASFPDESLLMQILAQRCLVNWLRDST